MFVQTYVQPACTWPCHFSGRHRFAPVCWWRGHSFVSRKQWTPDKASDTLPGPAPDRTAPLWTSAQRPGASSEGCRDSVRELKQLQSRAVWRYRLRNAYSRACRPKFEVQFVPTVQNFKMMLMFMLCQLGLCDKTIAICISDRHVINRNKKIVWSHKQPIVEQVWSPAAPSR